MERQRSLNTEYAAWYSREFTQKVCNEFFESTETISGEEIATLTPCRQLNLMVIKSLFESWQEQMDLLSRIPFFDFKDKKVISALEDFMNALSRAIKIRQEDFKPLLERSMEKTLKLSVEPFSFMEEELQEQALKSSPDFKGLRKYLKWHAASWQPAVDFLSESPESPAWREKLLQGFDSHFSEEASPEKLLAPISAIMPIDMDQLILWESDTEAHTARPFNEPNEDNLEKAVPADEEAGEAPSDERSLSIDPALAWARFESEEHAYMKGSIEHIREGMGINQRIMFTKRLFQGNPDLMDQALEELDRTDSFFDAVSLMNSSFVNTLKWDVHSDEVQELLQLVFRKFDEASD
ncbi:hypothetical protein [Cyclobacterium jeungdonense]|uniref:Uncharacterized protein n=1 Tax=Cyclobacterium jeungdonense TaxID=708087 RepID=A0ABT8C7K3_9BACT|nr:hypothetical protein [Cyclobacterium jeungdonense]MDN3688750.1 hypothetical protein [Cyclobacterium jeungdonense]